MLGRAKSCQWQVFVRRRPPKQGEFRTDVSKATMFQGDRAAKDLIGFVRSCCLGVLIRGLENLEAPWEGFNFVRAKLWFGRAESRFAEPRAFPKRERFLLLFAACKKYRKNTLGRAKSCRWQVFVRRRPPKQGELRTDVSKATMFQGDDSVLRPRFKALPEKISAKLSDNTSRNRLFAQNGGEKALNRCDVPALQRKDLKRT